MLQTQSFKSGLKPQKPDRRDYSHHKTYGSVGTIELPDEYVLPSGILNQGVGFKCTAYSTAAVEETHFGYPFDPEWFYDQEGVEAGAFSSDGYDMRTTMATAKDRGVKPLDQSKPIVKEDDYYAIDGKFDLFDNVRVAMWMAQSEKRCAMLGAMWYQEWFYAHGGIVPTTYKKRVGLHATKCAGWKKLPDGEIYMVIQNSVGMGLGDQGMYYIPRSVFNKEFRDSHFMWRTTPQGTQVQAVGRMGVLLKQLADLLVQLRKALSNQP